jgi:hypothetical protein
VAASASPLRSTSRAQERFPAREINWIIYQAPGGSRRGDRAGGIQGE